MSGVLSILGAGEADGIACGRCGGVFDGAPRFLARGSVLCVKPQPDGRVRFTLNGAVVHECAAEEEQ